MDIEHNQMGTKQLEYFQIVESNCEFLTELRKLIDPQEIKKLPLLETYQIKEDGPRFNYEGFVQALIQVCYLVYTCRYYGFPLGISKQNIRIEEKITRHQKRFGIVIFYKLGDSECSVANSQLVTGIYNYLFSSFYEPSVQKISQRMVHLDPDYSKAISLFVKEYQMIVGTLVNESNQQKRETTFFKALEETSLFMEYSMLLRIKNNSMVNRIASQPTLFMKKKGAEAQYIASYISKKQKGLHDDVKNKERQIQLNIHQFFSEFVKANPHFEEKKKEANKQEEEEKSNKIIFQMKEGQYESNFIKRVSQVDSSFSSCMFDDDGYAQIKSNTLEIQIEYLGGKNTICVKLIPHHLILSMESTDFLLVQSNILTFESVNINMQMCEIMTNRKALVFRGLSCFNSKQKEPPLEKILSLIDCVYIAYRICEPELNITYSPSQTLLADPIRVAQVSLRLNHYTKMLLRCIKKVYNQ